MLLGDSLPKEVRRLVRQVEGTRAADGSDEVTEAEVATQLATAAAAETRTLLDKLKEERGQDDRGAQGLEATAAALSEARVAVLLVPAELDGTLWYGAEPVPVAPSRQALQDLGGGDPHEGPAADVLIRAALGTGAAVRIVPPAGVGGQPVAILRW